MSSDFIVEKVSFIRKNATWLRDPISAGADRAFPRLELSQALVHAIGRYSKLSKVAASSLIGLGQAIHPTATPAELNVFIQATLSQETYVRNACLQALQVSYLFLFVVIYQAAHILIQPFDLTDLDWSVELWLACHDEDEQNARLATQLWEENGFDVPEKFCSELMALLGMRICEHSNLMIHASVQVTRIAM